MGRYEHYRDSWQLWLWQVLRRHGDREGPQPPVGCHSSYGTEVLSTPPPLRF